MSTWRVSSVESYRRYLNDEEGDLASILRDLQGFEPSEKMLAGTAWHKVLELASLGDIIDAAANGFTFTVSVDIDLSLPEIRELRAAKTYMVDGKPITITGQVDAIEGLRIIDHKTTARFDPERFMAAFQWRLYLEIFGADSFEWNVFEMKETGPRHYEIFAFHPLAQCRYPGMEKDCELLVADFARFTRKYLPDYELRLAA